MANQSRGLVLRPVAGGQNWAPEAGPAFRGRLSLNPSSVCHCSVTASPTSLRWSFLFWDSEVLHQGPEALEAFCSCSRPFPPSLLLSQILGSPTLTPPKGPEVKGE